MKAFRGFLAHVTSLVVFLCIGALAADSSDLVLPAKAWAIFSKTPGESALGAVTAAGEMNFLAVGKSGETFSGACQAVPCTPGQELVFRVDVRVAEALQNGRGQISIEWRDARGQEVARSFGPVWGPEIGQSEQGFEMTAVAPDGTMSAGLVVTLFEDGGTKGSFEVSGATLRR